MQRTLWWNTCAERARFCCERVGCRRFSRLLQSWSRLPLHTSGLAQHPTVWFSGNIRPKVLHHLVGLSGDLTDASVGRHFVQVRVKEPFGHFQSHRRAKKVTQSGHFCRTGCNLESVSLPSGQFPTFGLREFSRNLIGFFVALRRSNTSHKRRDVRQFGETK